MSKRAAHRHRLLRKLTAASRSARLAVPVGPLRRGTYRLLFEVAQAAATACRRCPRGRIHFHWRGVRLVAGSSATGIVRVYHPQTLEMLVCSGAGAAS